MLLRLVFVLCGLFLTSSLFAAAIELVDDRGKLLTLPAAPQRIVSLAPHITELVFAVQAGRQLVGVSAHSDYPDAARGLPRIGDATAIDMERLLALQPQLVLAWHSGTRVAIIERIEALGIPVFVMAPQGLDSIARDLRRLGHLSGHVAQAEQVASDYQQVLQTLRERYAGARPVRVFLQIHERPLYTLNGRQVISEALGVCGGVNVFADLPELAAPVSFEAVIAADPDMIVATSELPGDNPARRVWQAFPMLRAVQHAQLFAIDADLLNRPTPRMLQGIEQLCDLLQEARRNQDG